VGDSKVHSSSSASSIKSSDLLFTIVPALTACPRLGRAAGMRTGLVSGVPSSSESNGEADSASEDIEGVMGEPERLAC